MACGRMRDGRGMPGAVSRCSAALRVEWPPGLHGKGLPGSGGGTATTF